VSGIILVFYLQDKERGPDIFWYSFEKLQPAGRFISCERESTKEEMVKNRVKIMKMINILFAMVDKLLLIS